MIWVIQLLQEVEFMKGFDTIPEWECASLGDNDNWYWREERTCLNVGKGMEILEDTMFAIEK